MIRVKKLFFFHSMPASETKDKNNKKGERQLLALKKRITKTQDILKTLQDKLKGFGETTSEVANPTV